MSYYLLAIGGTGNKILEALVYACAADALYTLDEDNRRVPIPERMVPIFDAWRAESTDEYLFPGPNGGPCDSKADWKAWRESLARADVPAVPLHGARGSAATLLADMGVPDWRIAAILGHAQVSITQRAYLRNSDEAASRAIGGLIGELLP